MKVILMRDIPLHKAYIYLTIERNVTRPDIKKYLEDGECKDKIVTERVKNYFRNIGIYDHDGNLTHYGKSVKENGLVKQREQGKYLVWYTKQDPFLKIKYFTSSVLGRKNTTGGLVRLGLILLKKGTIIWQRRIPKRTKKTGFP